MSRLVFVAPLALLMAQSGMVIATIAYYLAIQKIVREKRPVWTMGLSYLFTIFALTADIAEHANQGVTTTWRPIMFIAVSVFGLIATSAVLRYEVRELRKLQSKNAVELHSRVLAIGAKIDGIRIGHS